MPRIWTPADVVGSVLDRFGEVTVRSLLAELGRVRNEQSEIDDARRGVMFAMAESVSNWRRSMRSQHEEYLKIAYGVAKRSGDLSTQNGAVLVRDGSVISFGWNDIFPANCATDERRQRPLKYQWTEHAERAAIYAAARAGESTSGATLYCPWLACADCGRAIVLAGISRVVRHRIPQHSTRPDWSASISVADEMMRSVGIEIVDFEGSLGVKFRFDGQEIEV